MQLIQKAQEIVKIEEEEQALSQAELEFRSLPALKNQAQRLAMKLDLNKGK